MGGWTSGPTHYFSIFASFSSDCERGYQTRLLTISPIIDESHLGAKEHINFLSYILKLFHKTWNDVVSIVSDNCSTNKSIANK